MELKLSVARNVTVDEKSKNEAWFTPIKKPLCSYYPSIYSKQVMVEKPALDCDGEQTTIEVEVTQYYIEIKQRQYQKESGRRINVPVEIANAFRSIVDKKVLDHLTACIQQVNGGLGEPVDLFTDVTVPPMRNKFYAFVNKHGKVVHLFQKIPGYGLNIVFDVNNEKLLPFVLHLSREAINYRYVHDYVVYFPSFVLLQ